MPPITSPRNDYLGFAYSALLATGGLIGYVRKGSIPSLIGGGLGGALAGYGALRVTHNPDDVRLALGVSSALTLMMGARFIQSGKFMPAGMISILSLLMTVKYADKVVR